jgi:outer membrane receptor protein involved in Fe transport
MAEPRIILSTLFLIVFLFNDLIYSQEVDTLKVQRLLEMSLEDLLNTRIVVASKIPRLSTDITQKIDVVSEQHIKKIISGNRNIAELIQYVPGASVKVLSRNDANWGGYGGIGPKYSTYMMLGVPIDAFIDPMNIDALAIQHIEIQRGPASVLYPNYLSQDFAGNQSPLAGTVNLILKELVAKPKSMVSLAYGSYNTYTGQAYHENHLGRLNVFGGVSYEKSDYTNYGSSGSWLNMIKNPEYQKGKAYFGATGYIDKEEKHKITLFGIQTLHWGDFGRVNREFDNQYSLLNAGYTSQLTDNLEISIKTGLRWYDRDWQGDIYDTASLSYILLETSGVEQMIVPVDLSVSYNHFNNSNLTIGTDYQHASYFVWMQPVNLDKTTQNDALASQIGVYIQEEMQLKKLTLRAGGRFNIINHGIDKFGGQIPGVRSQSWNVILWSAGAKYRLNKGLTLFTNTGNSFMSPGLKSIGGTLRSDDIFVPGMNGQLPNPDLKSEGGISLDLGFDWKLPFNFYTSFRAFNTTINDAIIDIVISQNPSQTMSINTDGKTIGRGFEFSVTQHIEKKIDWFANVTYTKSKIVDPDNPDQDGVEIPFVPKVISNAGITFYLPFEIEVNPRLHFSGRIYDSSLKSRRNSYDSGELLNMIMSKTFIFNEDKKLSVSIHFYNITNNKFDMPWQFRDPGFNINFGTRMIF